MCEFDTKYLAEMEERLDKKINAALERTRSDVVNEATKTALLSVKEDFTKEVSSLKEFMEKHTLSSDEMQTIKTLLEGFNGLTLLSKMASGLSKFIISVGVIAAAFFAFVKLGLK
jgi:hypothetical protein